jgi:basic membrane protein A
MSPLSRKTLIAVATAILAVFVAACGGGSSSSTGSGGSSGESTTASSETGSEGSGCGYGFVFPTPLGSNASERDIAEGLEKAASEGGQEVKIVESQNPQTFIANLEALAAEGCYTSIGTSFFESSSQLEQVANAYPEQQFFITDGLVELPNVTNFAIAPQELTFVAGAMAAELSKSKKIGAILGEETPALLLYSEGLEQGAQYIDPSVEVETSSVGSFTDPAKGGTLAVAQASQGVDLIYPASGSNLEIYAQAASHGYEVIASDPGELEEAKAKNDAIAFVAIVDQAAEGEQALLRVLEGEAEGGVQELGIKEHVFDVPGVTGGKSEFSLPPTVIAAGKKALGALESGEVKVEAGS